MLKPLLAVTAALGLTACASLPWGSEPNLPASYAARGNEPGWTLEMAGEDVVLATAYGAEHLTGRVTGVRETDDGLRYAAVVDGSRTVVRVAERFCRDSMSGLPYPDTVTVERDGETLAGCGGDPGALLRDRTWRVVAIGDGRPATGSPPTITFSDTGRIGGFSGCNSYAGAYRISGEGMTVEGVATTMRACPPETMRRERTMLDIIGAIARYDIADDGMLILEADPDRRIAARP